MLILSMTFFIRLHQFTPTLIFIYLLTQVAVIEPIVATSGPKLIVEDESPPVKMVAIKPPRPQQVDDDWFVLLDVAPKSSGIYCVDSS